MKTALTSHLLVIKLVGYKTALRANSFYCIAVELESYSSLLLNPKLKKFGILLFFFDQALRLYVIETFKGFNIKQLLDEVFVISRMIKVEVGIISRSPRLRLITLTETLIILDIT